MAYGTVKVDNITFDNGGSDQNVTVSGLYNSLTSGITVTGTISGAVVIGSTSVSGTTVAGVTVTGTTVQGASGTFTSLTGTTIQGTTATYTTGSFTSLTGTTTTGTTSSFTSGVFTTLSGATATFTSGIIASGTAAAPSLAILGDPDTGVFSPGANQLAVATNGTGRLFVDASGRLLVGTSTARTGAFYNGDANAIPRLQIEAAGTGAASSASAAIGIVRNSDVAGAQPYLAFARTRGTTLGSASVVSSGDGIGTISFQSADGTDFVEAASITAQVDGTPGANDMPGRLVFSTTADGAATPTERLRITSAGLVGIGTSAPAGLLNVSSNTVGNPSLTYDTSNIANFDYGIIQLALGINAAAPFGAFLQARDNTNAARVISLNPSGGNVGIGTTSPGNELSVVGTGNATTGWSVGNEDGATSGGLYNTGNTSNSISISTDPGNVGANSTIAFLVDASERARIDSSGRLLVGTSSASTTLGALTAKLQVQGTSAFDTGTSTILWEASANPALLNLVKSRGASVGTHTVVQDNDNLGRIAFGGSDGTNFETAAWIQCAVDGTPGANDMPGRLTFSTTADGASTPTERLRITSAGLVGIGTSAPGTKLHVNTGGVAGNLAYFEDGINSDFYIKTASLITTIGPNAGSTSLAFQTSGTERMRTDSSGRLLVGTSSARSNLFNTTIAPAIQLEGAGIVPPHRFLSVINNYEAAGDGGGVMVLGRSKGETVGSNTVVASGDQLGRFDFQGNDGTDFVTGAAIEGWVDGTPGANDMPGRLVFSTTADGASTSTERMRIRSDGNVGIGSAGFSTVRVYAQGSDTSSGNWAFYGVNSVGAQLFSTRNDGAFNTGTAALSPYNITTGVAANVVVDAGGYLYRSTSSARFKTDIETLEDSYADALLDVRPIWYRSIAPGDTAHPDWGYWGFIAEEVAEIDPRLVFWKTHETQKDEDNNDIQVELEEPLAEGVQYDRFVPHLLNLIKRQQQAIETLEVKVAALESA